MDVVLQVLLALVVPVGWGLLSAYLFDKYRERRGAPGECAPRDMETNSR